MKAHVILDTNVLIAGLRSRRGASFALLELLAEDAFEISVSVPLVLEYEAVARRQARELGLTHADVDAVVDFDCLRDYLKIIRFRPMLLVQRYALPNLVGRILGIQVFLRASVARLGLVGQ